MEIAAKNILEPEKYMSSDKRSTISSKQDECKQTHYKTDCNEMAKCQKKKLKSYGREEMKMLLLSDARDSRNNIHSNCRGKITPKLEFYIQPDYHSRRTKVKVFFRYTKIKRDY